MASAPISRDARLALQKLIENKMTWISIKHLLRQDANQLALIMEMGENANIEESMRLTYQSVYYQMNKTMKSKSQLDTDLAKSLVMWKEKIVQSGGYCFTKNMETMNDGMFAFAFCSQWQMNVSIWEKKDEGTRWYITVDSLFCLGIVFTKGW
ncbi:hypothetical protein BC941DRAFT_414003 [Chlamydoabsidia padenii]|nr:hypothetical protein BC941DRAFT_414003 [Chlamydoabsidia padenii]